MSLYESVFIARQDISSSQVEQLADQFTEILSENGGEVKKRELWGIRNLAYKINKNRKGHYVLFNIDGPSAAVQEMERQMRIHEDILRYMTIRMDELEEGPSAIMQSKSEKSDRGRGDRGDRGDRRGPRNFDRDQPQDAAKSEAKPDAKPEAKPETKEAGESE